MERKKYQIYKQMIEIYITSRALGQQAAHITRHHPPSPAITRHLPAAQQEPCKKPISNKKDWRIFWKKGRRISRKTAKQKKQQDQVEEQERR